MARLLDFPFTRVLPGHGHRHHADNPARMREDLARALEALERL